MGCGELCELFRSETPPRSLRLEARFDSDIDPNAPVLCGRYCGKDLFSGSLPWSDGTIKKGEDLATSNGNDPEAVFSQVAAIEIDAEGA